MMLTLVTHTRNERPELLQRAVASIEAAAPSGVKHKIIECRADWGRARLEATQLDEYIAFVDDDDTIEPGVIEHMLEAAKQTKAGIIISTERLVDLAGAVLSVRNRAKDYASIRAHPSTIHHLCMIRADAVDPRALDVHRKFDAGADWCIKASAALTHGAVHVPLIGYNWTQHEGSMSRSRNPTIIYELGLEIRRLWPRADLGPIPIWKL
jgi:glycosyltransferase involved in cell wall biosynthesis